MLIEAKAAFYNEATGAVQPWRDIEVTDTVGEGLIGEGLAVEIAEGGGGGDSDFSTAEVTFINSESGKLYTVNPVWPAIAEDGLKYPDGTVSIDVASSHTFMIPMYKGRAVVSPDCISDSDTQVMPTFTGGVEFDESYNFVITGDGTITAKGAAPD